jgi:hypothetical protein
MCWYSGHAQGETSTTVSDVIASPVDVGVRLVSEMASQISPELTEQRELKKILRANRKEWLLAFVNYNAIKL